MENGSKRRSEGEIGVLDKVGEVISELNKSKHETKPFARFTPSLFFSSLSILLSSQVLSASGAGRRFLVLKLLQLMRGEKRVVEGFYRGVAFRSFARVLLVITMCVENCIDSNGGFGRSAQKHVYDVFFVNGLATKVVQILVPYLQQSRSGDLDVNAVHSNTKRDGLRTEVTCTLLA